MNDPDAFITVLYSCPPCGIKDREVKVRARGGEDVVAWLEQVCAIALSLDHRATSPHCRARQMTNLKIPMTGTNKVGGVTKQ